MPDLEFSIDRAENVQYAATPQIAFQLNLKNNPAGESIHSVILRCQIQIEVTRRRYSAQEQSKLGDLFGEPERWSRTLRTMLWTHVSCTVNAFQERTEVQLQVPCTFDFNVAATKYFYGLSDGDIPLLFQFSGTVFYQGEEGRLSVAPVPWDKEAKFRLPLNTWRQTIENHYPNSAWLCLRRDIFDRLYQYKVQQGIPTWEQALERLLAAREELALHE